MPLTDIVCTEFQRQSLPEFFAAGWRGCFRSFIAGVMIINAGDVIRNPDVHIDRYRGITTGQELHPVLAVLLRDFP